MRTKGTHEEATTNPLRALKLFIIALHFGYYSRIEFQWNGNQDEPVKIKNPLLDNEENWEEYEELVMTWEEVKERNHFFNETDKRLTFSRDTTYDPQGYMFYKPKEGIPYYIPQVISRKVFVVHCNKNRKNVPWWVKSFVLITYPLRFIPKRDIKKMSKRTCYSLRVGSLSNGISLEFHIPKKFSLK